MVCSLPTLSSKMLKTAREDTMLRSQSAARSVGWCCLICVCIVSSAESAAGSRQSRGAWHSRRSLSVCAASPQDTVFPDPHSRLGLFAWSLQQRRDMIV